MDDRQVTENGNVKIVQLDKSREGLLGDNLEEGDIALLIKGIFESNSPVMGGKEVDSYIEIDKVDRLVEEMKKNAEVTSVGDVKIMEQRANVENICSFCEGELNRERYQVRKEGVVKFTTHLECLEKLANKIEKGMDENTDFIAAGLL